MNVKRVIVQLCATFCISIVAAQASFAIVWPSYSLKILQSEASPLGFGISKLESNLIGSIPNLTSLVVTLAAGLVTEAIGRKRSQILCGLFFVVAWSMIVTARSTVQLMLARLVIGCSTGLAIVTTMLFTSELTEQAIRGSAIALVTLLYNLGVLFSYLMGWFCSYDVICYVNVTVAVAYVLLVSCFKDSPVYLLKNGKEKEALISLKFYRGAFKTNRSVLEEFSNLKNQNRHSNEKDLDKANNPTENEKLCKIQEEDEKKNSFILLLTIDHNRRALFTIVLQMVLSVSMGMIAVQTYASRLFAAAAPALSSDLCSVLFAVVLLASSVLTIMVADLVGRRFLMILTCAVVTACLAMLGSQLRWAWAPAWATPAIIAVYCLAFHLGCINVPFIQLGESFGPQVNSAATAIVLCSMFLSNFIVLLLFVPLVDLLGIDGTFFAFAGNGLIGTIILTLIVKETRMIPLEKVQQMYAKGYLYKKCDT